MLTFTSRQHVCLLHLWHRTVWREREHYVLTVYIEEFIFIFMHYCVRVSLDLEKLSYIGLKLKKFDNLTSHYHTYVNFNTSFNKLGNNVLNVPLRVHKHPVLYVIAIVFFFC